VKAIPVWQPYASLIACGAKSIETRHWCAKASMIGERLAIYATKRKSDLWLCERAPFNEHVPDPDTLPLGALVATVIITASRQMTGESIDAIAKRDPHEIAFGSYQPGRWAWHLGDVQAVDPAVEFKWPVRGTAAFVRVPDGLLEVPAR
jgi:hypothetical protein